MRATVTLRAPHPKQEAFIRSASKRIIIRAGRRGGKTTGIATRHVEKFLAGHRVLYAAPTQDQTERYWFEITQALAEPIAAGLVHQNETSRFIELPGTEQRIKAKTAWNPDTLRGDYGDEVCLDEFQLMDEATWLKVVAPMMLDKDGTTVFIYTPPSSLSAARSQARDPMYAAKMYLEAQRSPRWECFTFTSHDNPHLSKIALDEITLDMSDRDYRQEILAEDIFETPGALWSQADIDAARVDKAPAQLEAVVISIDPSKSSTSRSDECGVVVCGLDAAGIGYALEDLSEVAPPEQWAATACDAVERYSAQAGVCFIVAEDNQGGDMIRTVIHSVNPRMRVELIPAVVDKYLRAQPVRARWGRGECRIVGKMNRLEYQMTTWIKGVRWSPDRMDAMVHGLRFLMLPRDTRREEMIIHDEYEPISRY